MSLNQLNNLLPLAKKYGLALLMSCLYMYQTISLNTERRENQLYIREIQNDFIKKLDGINDAYLAKSEEEYNKYIKFVDRQANVLIDVARSVDTNSRRVDEVSKGLDNLRIEIRYQSGTKDNRIITIKN